jgi:hypothetical protein
MSENWMAKVDICIPQIVTMWPLAGFEQKLRAAVDMTS